MNTTSAAGPSFTLPRAWKKHLACVGFSFCPMMLQAAEVAPQSFRNVSYVPSEKFRSEKFRSEKIHSPLNRKLEEIALSSLSTDAVLLRDLASDYNLPMVPVLALQHSGSGNESFEVIGLRESTVVRARVEGRTISMHRLGSVVDIADRRLDPIENSVQGAHLLVAYQSPEGELVGLVGTGASFYLVHKLGQKSLAISRLTALRD